jgi:hypothetical protein
MSNETTNAYESTDLDARDARALTEYMTVLAEGGDVYSVTTESGSEYRVDARAGRCTCPDARHNLDDAEACKHEKRVAFATGARPVPAHVDVAAVDPDLGAHVDARPRVATDGGEVVAPNPDDDGDDSDDCACAELPDGVPCFPCYADGAAFDD